MPRETFGGITITGKNIVIEGNIVGHETRKQRINRRIQLKNLRQELTAGLGQDVTNKIISLFGDLSIGDLADTPPTILLRQISTGELDYNTIRAAHECAMKLVGD